MEKLRDITVLYTACGAIYTPAFIDCLKDNGERNIRVIGADMAYDETMIPLIDKLYVTPKAIELGYIDSLLEICEKEKVDVLIPGMSNELLKLLENKEKFDAIGTKVSLSNRKSIEIATDKYRFYSFLKENNLPVPKFALVRCADDLIEACKYCGYPEKSVCVKATNLSGSRGIRIIKSDVSRFDILFGEKPNSMYTTMEELLSTLREKNSMPEMMAMEYLPGVEGSVDIIGDNGKVIYAGYRESTVNLASIPQVAEIKENKEAIEIAKAVCEALGIDGNADFDFKADENGHPVLMEVNPRVAATMKIFKKAGMNLPYLRIKQLLGEELPKVEIKYGVKMKRRYQEMFSE